MALEANRPAVQPSQPSAPQVSETSNVDKAHLIPEGLMNKVLGLHTVPKNSEEVSFITDKIMEMGGMEGPSQFTNLLMNAMRDAKHSPFHTGDNTKDLFMFLKMKETAGSVLNGWE